MRSQMITLREELQQQSTKTKGLERRLMFATKQNEGLKRILVGAYCQALLRRPPFPAPVCILPQLAYPYPPCLLLPHPPPRTPMGMR